ncbi:hypothetical protein [Rhizobium sp. 18065]|uniref:hypothetical protein n=1 Tax=Rhizobium sp. 18065 TaxID=2681411 RepID=UPI00135BD10E|nr:hypothetical protein [Rhizobium sp. 18065]
MRWKRLGRIVEPKRLGDWCWSHAAYPIPLVTGDQAVRIFFSVRDKENRAHSASIDFHIVDESATQASEIKGPLFGPGPRGGFDCDGVTISCLVPHNEKLLAYYLGWTLTKTVPFTNFIGVAIGDSDGTKFTRVRASPIIGRSELDPFSVGYPFVMKDRDGWRMWYGTHLEWGATGLEMTHVIREAESSDGINWTPSKEVCIPVIGGDEFAVSRPWILECSDGYTMFYSRRYSQYRLGSARSVDGRNWIRDDKDFPFIGKAEAWEADAQTYASFFKLKGKNYMIYNGNDYGRTGIGLAILE